MEVIELFSKGADILKKNVVVAVPLVAVGILSAVLTITLMGGVMAGAGMMGMGGFRPGLGTLGAFMGTAVLVSLLIGLLNLIAYGMTYVMAEEAISGKADLNTGFQKTMSNIANLLVASIILGVIVFIGMILLVLPGIIAAYLLMFTLVLVMLEKQAPVAALQGSFELVKSHINETLIFAVIALVILVVAGIIGAILGPLSPIISGAAMAYISIVLVLLHKELKK